MALSYPARRRLSLLILLVGLPLYVVAAVTILNWLDRPPVWVEVPVYLALGFLWMVPFRFEFLGIDITKARPQVDEGASTDGRAAPDIRLSNAASAPRVGGPRTPW